MDVISRVAEQKRSDIIFFKLIASFNVLSKWSSKGMKGSLISISSMFENLDL